MGAGFADVVPPFLSCRTLATVLRFNVEAEAGDGNGNGKGVMTSWQVLGMEWYFQ
jgi:hypothetical protein